MAGVVGSNLSNFLTTGQFAPELLSKEVEKKYRIRSVCTAIANQKYSGDLKGKGLGNSIDILTEPNIEIKEYKRNLPVVSTPMNPSRVVLDLKNAFYFAVPLDDAEIATSNINWVESIFDSAAEQLTIQKDTEVLAYLGTESSQLLNEKSFFGGTATTAVKVGVERNEANKVETATNVLNKAVSLLDASNVKREDRWLVARPDFWEKIRNDPKVLSLDFRSEQVLENGQQSTTLIYGLKGYMSNECPANSLFVGQKDAFTYVGKIDKMEKLRNQGAFGLIIRGLLVYGRQIVKGEGLVKVSYTIA